MNGDDAGYLSLLVNVTRGIPDFSDASETLNFALERALSTRFATVAEYFMLSMLCILMPIWAVCKCDTPRRAVVSKFTVVILSTWTLMKQQLKQLLQNVLQQD